MRAACLFPLILIGCAAPEAGPREDGRCLARVWYRPDRALARPELKLSKEAAESPELIGSWHGFSRPGLRQFALLYGPDDERFLTVSLPLPPGRHSYGILVGDQLLTDDIEPQSTFGRDIRFTDSTPYEGEYSLIEVPDCSAPTLSSGELTARGGSDGNGALRWVADFQPGKPDGALDVASIVVTLRRGSEPLAVPSVTPQLPREDGGRNIVVEASGLSPGKYTLTLAARGLDGQTPAAISASIFVEPPSVAQTDDALHTPRPLADAVIYHLMIDRFRGDAGALPSPATPGQRAGGTLGGVTAAIESGYFEKLGITTLWLSPLYQNPTGFFPGRDGNSYESYHGYWPIAPRSVESRFGGEAALQALIASAHARGLRVIFDAVPNHVHRLHPYYRDHSRQTPPVAQSEDAAAAASWFHDGPKSCVCGAPGCGWGERVQDCWFTLYLPDLNWRHPDVMRAGVEDLLWWLERFDLDGMRIDAVPMMPRAATRRIVRATHQAVHRDGIDSLLIGEDYTGPGQAGRADIRSFLGSAFDGLDSAFDFPLMWALRSTLAHERTGLDELEREIAHSATAFAGSGAVMGHMLDNHDTPRFISEAAGNAGNNPWREPPLQPPVSDIESYRKHVLGLTLLLTLPGIPVVYYGDEVALAGANDPDSRRPLPDGSALLPMQAEVLDVARRLGRLRACSPSLRRGTRAVLRSGRDFTVALHTHESSAPILVALSRAREITRLDLEGVPPGRYRSLLDRTATLVVSDDGRAQLALPPLRPAIYLRDGDPCLSD